MKTIFVLLILVLLAFTGCVSESASSDKVDDVSIKGDVVAEATGDLVDAGDTVEIGEML